MRRLLLLRHAKAEPASDSGRDHDRPLSERGRRDAKLVGRFLAGAEITPDLVLSSTANRAQDTARRAIAAAGWPTPLRELPELYDSSVERSLQVLRSMPRSVATLLAVGHQPTWSQLGTLLVGGGRLRLPTAGLIDVILDVEDWAEAAAGSGLLEALITPDNLKALPVRRLGRGRAVGRD